MSDILYRAYRNRTLIIKSLGSQLAATMQGD
jgi:hypothetical protein